VRTCKWLYDTLSGQLNESFIALKPLLKIMGILLAFFAVLFILGQFFDILTVENVTLGLQGASEIDALTLSAMIIVLLCVDIFITVPTLTITLLAGFFLGFPQGALIALIGTSCATFLGYVMGGRWGEPAIGKIIRNDADIIDLTATFHTHGPLMITLARAAPMVPEICALLAGATNMKFGRYALFHFIGTLPYVAIASYAGSVSSVDDPMPAIYGAMFLYAIGWGSWFLFRKWNRIKI
jgi:uncharacterized membrane protein YdjX (TVP38/TMEM64 family)